MMENKFIPVKVLELELADENGANWDSVRYDRLYMLVRFHGKPIGWVAMNGNGRTPVPRSQLMDTARDRFCLDVLPLALRPRVLPEAMVEKFPAISVVVCSRDRTNLLEQCLASLLALDYPEYEVIVVDNAPSTDGTARLVNRFPVRYAREDRPGLNWARNRGIIEAQYSIIAFVDDDARPDAGWLRAIASAFAEPEVMAVTGPVVPAELETPAQQLFEFVYGGMSHGFQRRIIRRSQLTPRDLLWASSFGVGANMAFRRELFRVIGDFDVALDVGTASGGGGDVEMFHRLVAGGYTLVYEPEALIWHLHRREDAALRKLVWNNGRSFGSYLLTCARNRTVSRFFLGYFAVRYWLWGWLLHRLLRPKSFPLRLVWCELAGALISPFAYLVAQRDARRIQTNFVAMENP